MNEGVAADDDDDGPTTCKARVSWLVVLALWLAVIAVAVPGSRNFFSRTTSDVLAGATLQNAEATFPSSFPQYSRARAVFVVASVNDDANTTLCSADLAELTASVRESVAQAGLSNALLGIFSQPTAGGDFIGQLFVSPDWHTAFVLVAMDMGDNSSSSTLLEEFTAYLSSEVLAYNTRDGAFKLGVTSQASMLDGAKHAAYRDSVLVWFVSVPLALGVTLLALRASVFLPLIIFCTAASLLAASALSNAVAFVWRPPSAFSPAITMAVVGTATVWWCTLVLRRFSERLERGHNTKYAATHAARSALPAVGLAWASLLAASASVACTTWVAAPYALLLALGVTVAALASITLVPAILFSTGSFFSIPGLVPCAARCRQRHIASSIDEANALRSSFLVFSFIKISARPWRSVVVVIGCLVLLCPFVILAARTSVVSDINELYTEKSDSAQAFAALTAQFPPSLLAPYVILHNVTGPDNATVFDEAEFVYNLEFVQRSLTRLISLPSAFARSLSTSFPPPAHIPFLRNVVSLSYLLGYRFTWSSAMALLDQSSPQGKTDMGRSYRRLSTLLVDDYGEASLILVVPKEDSARVAETFVPSFRHITELMSSDAGQSFTLGGLPVSVYDTMYLSMKQLLYAIGALVTAFAVTVSVFTQAPLLFFRLLISGALVLTAAVGFNTVAFDDAASWVAAVLSFPSLAGLCLAFEMESYARITEIRDSGFDKSSCVIRGLYTSRFLAPAGPLLVIAFFFPLLFSRTPTTADIATVHIVAAAIDLFIVRLGLSPALALLWGDMNWWPRRRAVIYTQATAAMQDSQFLKPLLKKVQRIVNAAE